MKFIEAKRSSWGWFNRGVLGILLATFFSDVGHEMVTSVLPLYLASLGVGPLLLGFMEGLADLLFSLSKLAGGIAGHRSERRHFWGTLGYLTTSLAVGAMGLVRSFSGLISLRAIGWFGRGFRSPLRDFLLADEVGKTHFGRAYGMERAADMLGAVAGPLVAALLIWLKCDLRTIILVSLVPSLISVFSFLTLVHDKRVSDAEAEQAVPDSAKNKLPKSFWLFAIGVFLFGLGDFSRTFLILLAAKATNEGVHLAVGGVSTAVLLYVLHNLISGAVAYPAGHLGDRFPKITLLLGGYLMGVFTNGLLAFGSHRLSWLAIAIVFSGTYIAIEETLEKAVAAEVLPRNLRSLGLGILASANAVGDMASSVYVGWMLERGQAFYAFMVPAIVGLSGVLWILFTLRPRWKITV